MALLDGVDPAQLSDRGLMHFILLAVLRLESQMSQMNEALGRLSTAVTEQRDRMQGQIDALSEALDAERQAASALASSEAAEDVAQGQELSDAQAATDAALAELQGGVDSVNSLADQVSQVQQGGGGGSDGPATPDQPDQPAPDAPAADQPQPPGGFTQ